MEANQRNISTESNNSNGSFVQDDEETYRDNLREWEHSIKEAAAEVRSVSNAYYFPFGKHNFVSDQMSSNR